MDLGLQGRRVALHGTGVLADHITALLAAEGAELIDSTGDLHDCDALVALAPLSPAAPLEAGTDEATVGAWDHIADLAAKCRAATVGMTERGYGRIVWVGPIDAKLTRDDVAADLDGLVGLGALGLLKALSGELGPNGITCNSVLWDGQDLEAAGTAVLFLASAPSAYVSGTALSVDGGKSGSIF